MRRTNLKTNNKNIDMFSNQDLKQIAERGIAPEVIEQQLSRFATGFPYLRIQSVATAGNGIHVLNDKQVADAIKHWRNFKGSIEKFVPASGAASRMFKNMFAFVNSGRNTPDTDFEHNFFNHINDFAFYPALNRACVKAYGKDIKALIEAERHVDVAKALLLPEGLNYGALPKALLQFHKIAAEVIHTPLEEHLEEGAQYAADAKGNVNLHFTVSPEHREAFNRLLDTQVPHLEKVWGVTYHVSMSEQKASTDTIAVLADNTPYREDDGSLLFRPAGHGALLENLNERDADVIFIKNIDNVVPSRLRNATVRYKKVLAGFLVKTQQQIARHLNTLDKGEVDRDSLNAMVKFLETTLSTHIPDVDTMNDEQLTHVVRTKLNRPIRVCGMVRNEGEPGGGPYLTFNADGSYSPQILEAAQINADDANAVALMNSGTHFNPVDLVCYIKDYKGNKFDLKQFVDHETGLISGKSKGGVEIKALELPGLWNGSMSDWNTVFIEVPAETFNPVKTVNDLLRKQHSYAQ